MPQIKGPGLFIMQFLSDKPPFDTLEHVTAWAKSLGYTGVQIPANNSKIIDLDKASESRDYCDEFRGRCSGLAITELATHVPGHLVAVNPAYDLFWDSFVPPLLRKNPKARAEWAVDTMKKAIKASQNLGLSATVTFTGTLLWHTVYPWPRRPAGLVDMGFQELAKRWQPILDLAQECGVALAYEVHPGEDVHDGASFERFLEATGNHPAVAINYDPSHFILQCMDYVGFIECYGKYIKAFHVKDAEYKPTAKAGVYGGYLNWEDRPGRFRSIGDGQVDFKQIFSKLTEVGYDSWAVLEWECPIKDAAQGAKEGAELIKACLIDTPQRGWDEFIKVEADAETNRKILGI
ncbi:MAG: sugar phosphate isomerase/epimerase [Dehalococcoidales bacterium]|nr:sugar phosphate isomerase/epimerase [Dehalococcoidales bacterium]